MLIAASFAAKFLRKYSKIRRLLIGWTSQPTTAAKALTSARSSTWPGSNEGVGAVVPGDKITGRVAGVAEVALSIGAAE